MRALQIQDPQDDERYHQYRGVEREVRHEVLRRPMIDVNDNHLDRLRQQLPVPATENSANSNSLTRGRADCCSNYPGRLRPRSVPNIHSRSVTL